MSFSSYGFSLGLRSEGRAHYFTLEESFIIQALFGRALDENWDEERIVKNFLAEIRDPGETITSTFITEMFHDFKKWTFRMTAY